MAYTHTGTADKTWHTHLCKLLAPSHSHSRSSFPSCLRNDRNSSKNRLEIGEKEEKKTTNFAFIS